MSTERRETTPEKVRIIVPSIEAGVEIVKEFWRAMPHGTDLTRGLREDVMEDWTQELTMGDRTIVIKGMFPNEKGKFVAHILGNNQPLSSEAVSWLKGKGYLQ